MLESDDILQFPFSFPSFYFFLTYLTYVFLLLLPTTFSCFWISTSLERPLTSMKIILLRLLKSARSYPTTACSATFPRLTRSKVSSAAKLAPICLVLPLRTQDPSTHGDSTAQLALYLTSTPHQPTTHSCSCHHAAGRPCVHIVKSQPNWSSTSNPSQLCDARRVSKAPVAVAELHIIKKDVRKSIQPPSETASDRASKAISYVWGIAKPREHTVHDR
ncbi:hypothetical protein CC80DRAFT_223115 [Byssothecium circinans]|uniref:SWIM-type domain-containing protein n=1 Tax=Byssothecium circinans TaxID=147558 RepID=A0A6A5TFA2_9PLEO|nr:hypothetical protein CC80DRAFT_223115 [Byssothecium circinans]